MVTYVEYEETVNENGPAMLIMTNEKMDVTGYQLYTTSGSLAAPTPTSASGQQVGQWSNNNKVVMQWNSIPSSTQPVIAFFDEPVNGSTWKPPVSSLPMEKRRPKPLPPA